MVLVTVLNLENYRFGQVNVFFKVFLKEKKKKKK